MIPVHRRHDMTDELWTKLEPNLPGYKGCVGRPAVDNRTFINAVFWIIRTGSPWRGFPRDVVLKG
jgi:transposase